MTIRRHDDDTDTGSRTRSALASMLIAAALLACNGDGDVADGDVTHRSRPADAGGSATTDADQPQPGASGISPHQHEPRHGGVVRSVDVYHVEIVPEPLAVWLYDRRGNDLPLEDVEGQIVVYSNDERHPHGLEIEDGHLQTVDPVALPDSGTAFVELTIGKQPIDVALSLPLDEASSGGIPRSR